MSTTILRTTPLPPPLESRQWLRPIKADGLVAMCESANHALCYKSALSFTHHFANNFAIGIHYLGNLGNVEIRRVTNRTFLANPNTVHGSADHTLTIADSDMEGDLKIARIDIPFTSPFVQHLQIVLRFQAHEYNIDPSDGLYSDLFTHPFSVNPSGSTAGSGLATLSDFMHYVDNPSAGMPQIEPGKPAVPPVQFSSSDFLDCDLRFRLRDASGAIIDPDSGSGWAVTLSHTNGGLRTGEGFKAEDTFPVREVALSVPSRIGATASERPRALEYGPVVGTGGGVVLEIGYRFVRPLIVTVSEIPPVVHSTSTYVSNMFPLNFPTGQPSANESNGVGEVYVYQGHIYLRFRANQTTASNGLVFFPEPPASVWPFTGMDISAAGVSGDADFDLTACASNQWEYQGVCYGNSISGELERIGASDPGFTGVPVPGDNSTQNNWTTAPASNPEWPSMGEMVLRNGGKVWHSAFNNWPDHVVTVPANSPYTPIAVGQLPTGIQRGFVRLPISSVTAWGGSLAKGETKSATCFTIYDSTITTGGKIYHAQEDYGGPAGMLNDFFGLGASAYTIGILENTVDLDAIKAAMDAAGIP
tara:strand:- start:921 stop:2687 length:1767 start_codon:yes stop_codon:yes gene_type:complete